MKFPSKIALSFLIWFNTPSESLPSFGKVINSYSSDDRSKIIRINSLLRGVGIDAARLAIVGGQSSGKSTVIEGILGIGLPKGDGTQTRVPIEIIASRGDHFVASVGVRNPSEPGNYLSAPEVVTDKASMEKTIREMQRRALKRPDGSEDEYSSTPVVVDVQDVGLYDLTFVDLPGLIQSFGKDPEKNHKKVLQVVETEATKPGTILIHVISAENNINNGQGKSILEKSSNDRIGVITKPDLLGKGDGDSKGIENEYTMLLQNKFPGQENKRGWYVVKSPVPNEDSSPETIFEERKNEMNFYKTDSKWKAIVQNADAYNRIGFSNLRVALEDILVEDFDGRKEEYTSKIISMIDDLATDISKTDALLKQKEELELNVESAVNGVLRQEKYFYDGVNPIKKKFDVAFLELRTKIMSEIPGFRLLRYTLNPKASKMENITLPPNSDSNNEGVKDIKKKKKPINEDMIKCVNKFDYYNMQKNNIHDLIENANVLSMADDILSIPTIKRLEYITKNWEQHAVVFFRQIFELVKEAAGDIIRASVVEDEQLLKSYNHAAHLASQVVNQRLLRNTNSIIKALVGPYTTDQEMLFTLKEAYAVYFGRVLEGNGARILNVIKNLQKHKMSVMRVAGVGAGGIALVAITASLISTITAMLPVLAVGSVAAPLLFLAPGGGSLFKMGASVGVAGVKLALKPFYMLSKKENQEKVKGAAGRLAGDLKKIVGTFSEHSQVHVNFDGTFKQEQVFQVWVEETAVADMMAHRLLRNMYMIASHDIVQKFSEEFSSKVRTSGGNPNNYRRAQITLLKKQLELKEEKMKRLQEAQKAISEFQ